MNTARLPRSRKAGQFRTLISSGRGWRHRRDQLKYDLSFFMHPLDPPLAQAPTSRRGIRVLLLTGFLTALPGLTRAADDISPGRYLASGCANCHGTQGNNPAEKGISLAGLKADVIVDQMRAFKEGRRPATVMHQIARGYSDEQIQVLATYFSKQVRK